jgi:hypothetical protein
MIRRRTPMPPKEEKAMMMFSEAPNPLSLELLDGKLELTLKSRECNEMFN